MSITCPSVVGGQLTESDRPSYVILSSLAPCLHDGDSLFLFMPAPFALRTYVSTYSLHASTSLSTADYLRVTIFIESCGENFCSNCCKKNAFWIFEEVNYSWLPKTLSNKCSQTQSKILSGICKVQHQNETSESPSIKSIFSSITFNMYFCVQIHFWYITLISWHLPRIS